MSSRSVPITVISADCDNLKKVNDTYGHMVGDEFLAFVPDTAAEAAESLIARIQENAVSYTIKDVTLSLSLGYCVMERSSDSLADCIKRSDADMYREKQRKKAARQ